MVEVAAVVTFGMRYPSNLGSISLGIADVAERAVGVLIANEDVTTRLLLLPNLGPR